MIGRDCVLQISCSHKPIPYVWNGMHRMNLANLMWSEYLSYELRSFFCTQFSSSTVCSKRNGGRAIKCGFTLNSLNKKVKFQIGARIELGLRPIVVITQYIYIIMRRYHYRMRIFEKWAQHWVLSKLQTKCVIAPYIASIQPPWPKLSNDMWVGGVAQVEKISLHSIPNIR